MTKKLFKINIRAEIINFYDSKKHKRLSRKIFLNEFIDKVLLSEKRPDLKDEALEFAHLIWKRYNHFIGLVGELCPDLDTKSDDHVVRVTWDEYKTWKCEKCGRQLRSPSFKKCWGCKFGFDKPRPKPFKPSLRERISTP
ncbi:MAG: RNA-binding protein 5 [Podoviridae sp. ctg2L5]|nr:MAG: RNA-binding protein 5 [Podoviridae sp. ctg2L5]